MSTFGVFSGTLSTRLPPGQSHHIKRSGYAACKLRDPPSSLFGSKYWDSSPFRYLLLRLRLMSPDRNSFFVNVQTGGLVQTDLFQHRLYFNTPGSWEILAVFLSLPLLSAFAGGLLGARSHGEILS